LPGVVPSKALGVISAAPALDGRVLSAVPAQEPSPSLRTLVPPDAGRADPARAGALAASAGEASGSASALLRGPTGVAVDCSGISPALPAAAGAPQLATASNTQRLRPVLASEVLREDLVPREPGARALRLIVGPAGAVLTVCAVLGRAENPHSLAA